MYFHNSLIPRGAYFLLPLESKQEATSGWNFTKCISEVKVNQLKVKNIQVKWAHAPLIYAPSLLSNSLILTFQPANHIHNAFMQPSMGILDSLSSRVIKDLTLSRRQIFRCINFGVGESSRNLYLNMMNLYLVKFEARWILNEPAFFVLLFCLFKSESWP